MPLHLSLRASLLVYLSRGCCRLLARCLPHAWSSHALQTAQSIAGSSETPHSVYKPLIDGRLRLDSDRVLEFPGDFAPESLGKSQHHGIGLLL